MEISYKKQIEIVDKLIKDKYEGSINHERYLHIIGVKNKVLELAEIYNVCKDKVYIAAMMHDYYKYETKEEMGKLLTEEELIEAKKTPVLFHSYASARAYLKLVGNDLEIFNAIKNHVFGCLNMTKLEEIILISDYIEENRTYDSCIYCRNLVSRNLFFTAIYESTRRTIELLKTRNVKPSPLQVKVLEEYEVKMQKELVDLLIEACEKVNAKDIKVLDSKYHSPFFDYTIICSVTSNRQIDAVSDYVYEYLTDTPYYVKNICGKNSNWLIVDCGNVVLHIFTEEERKRVDLDNLYLEYDKVN